MTCLDDNVASEFAAGGLAGASLARVEGHLAGCRDCRALVAALAGDDEHSDVRTQPNAPPAGGPSRMAASYSVGDRVGRYLILSKLGAGGMGVVFSAYDPQLDRKIALKLLRAGIGVTTKEARSRLKREAQAIAQLSHPNVVAAYDVGTTDDGDLYIAMEFVEGDTLTTWLKKWPRTWREILEVFQQAGRGLAAAHGVNLLHRDFKPDNVLVGGDGRVRVSDFGLARSLLGGEDGAGARDESSQVTALAAELTATGTVLGTPRYMPPEQLVGPDIDARSDQFSFCVALYEALYGMHPLPGGTAVSMMESGARAAAPPNDTRVPPAIARAVGRGLDRDRGKRYASMQALLVELTPPPARSKWTLVAAGLGVLLVGGAGAAAAMRREGGGPPAPDDTWALERLHKLEQKVDSLDRERRALYEKLEKYEHQPDEVQRLREELKAKDAKIDGLLDQVTQLSAVIHGAPGHGAAGATGAAGAAMRAAPGGGAGAGGVAGSGGAGGAGTLAGGTLLSTQPAQVLAALEAARENVRGCFLEWGERPNEDGGLNGDSPGKLAVRLDVCASGSALREDAAGIDSPALKLCVASAFAHVRFPAGPEDLELQVLTTWATGQLTIAPHVAAHHEPRPSCELE